MRTISDERRREVAAWMRSESESWRDTFPSSKLGDDDNEAIVFDISSILFEENPTVSEFFARLTDLIDRPTCKPVIPNEMDGCVFCPQCGAEIGEYGVPNYCYNCGVAISND